MSGIAIASAAWKRTAAASSFVLVDPRQLELADDDLLVRDAEAHVPGQRAGAEDLLEHVAEGLGVDDLAVVHDTLGQLGADGRLDAAVGDRHGGQEVAVEVKPDAAARACIGA